MSYDKDEIYYTVIPKGDKQAYRLLTTRSLLLERFENHSQVVEALENKAEHISIALQGDDEEILDERLLIKTPKDIAEDIRDDIIEVEGEDIMAKTMVAFPANASDATKSIPDED